jgi:hypothetical protein
MKNIILFVSVLLMIAMPLWADSNLEAENMMRSFNEISLAIDHEFATFQPGVVLGADRDMFPLLSLNIPFGGIYFIDAGLGAGRDQHGEGELTLFHLGLGVYDYVKKMEDLNYSLGISYNTFHSLYYTSSILKGEVLLEQLLNNVKVGVGFYLSSQDYTILAGGNYAASQERIYNVGISTLLRSPFGNIRVNGTPESLSLSLSWTFKLERNS